MARVLVILLVLSFLGNLVVLDYLQFYKPGGNTPPTSDGQYSNEIQSLKEEIAQLKESQVPDALSQDSVSCPEACVSLIDKKPAAKSTGPAAVTSQKGEYVIPLGTGTVSKIGSWENVDTAQAMIDTGNYGPIAETYFEAVLHVPSGAGEVKAKLLDVTTPYSFDGNQISTTSSTGQLASTKIAAIRE